MNDPRYWIKHLDLKQHPEGGYYRETYRSAETISADALPRRYGSGRSMGTCIYYLLTGSDISRLHRLKSDEIWHFYKGSELILHCFDQEGNYSEHHLGGNREDGCRFQIIISQGTWFGAEVKDTSSYALVGCTVAPGFDFNDFEIAKKKDLYTLYPRYKKIIEKLTR